MQYADAARRTDDEWRERCAGVDPTWLALDDGRPVGTVGLWHAPDQPADEVCLVGMWVATVARGTDVATPAGRHGADPRRGIRLAAGGARRGARERPRPRVLRADGVSAHGRVGRMPWDPSVTEETLALDLPVGA